MRFRGPLDQEVLEEEVALAACQRLVAGNARYGSVRLGQRLNGRKPVLCAAGRAEELPKVATEMALHVLAYNLTRVLNIMGIGPLLAAMRA